MDEEQAAFAVRVRSALLSERHDGGYWVGELSSSALSTATAVFTLSLHREECSTDTVMSVELMNAGLQWLADHQNSDGGWGDTTKSLSNISTTALCWAVFAIPTAKPYGSVVQKAEAWLTLTAGSLEPAVLAKTIADRYGQDRTFSVPILTMLALAGRLGRNGWKHVPQLPFEFAALPHWCFQVLRLPVVSYALPALIAIGLVKHRRRPTWNPLTRGLRWLTTGRTLGLLRRIQPTTGGYLEATPLTSFVCMSLIGAGHATDTVVSHGIDFLKRSVRPDGSWPIDTNLTTWVTTLAIQALGTNACVEPAPVLDWLQKQQYRTRHPYTQAEPGGWAWTDRSGGVPDADDTPGALLAWRTLLCSRLPTDIELSAAKAGVEWLLNLQNSDGGIPTFCKGWTGLPFDRSSNDLTAHAMLAWSAWRDDLPLPVRTRIGVAFQRAFDYLSNTQQLNGSWAPLWFGNQHGEDVPNLTYGTSRVLRLAELNASRPLSEDINRALHRGAEYLISTQNADGGWGGRLNTPSSIEETALALEGLAIYFRNSQKYSEATPKRLCGRAIRYIRIATQEGTHFPPTPIGFYFANLWYFEKLYPLIHTVAALTQVDRLLSRASTPSADDVPAGDESRRECGHDNPR